MKQIKKKDLEHDEHYLVFAGYFYSPSGYDICQYDKYKDELCSQTTNDDVLNLVDIKIYELPIN